MKGKRVTSLLLFLITLTWASWKYSHGSTIPTRTTTTVKGVEFIRMVATTSSQEEDNFAGSVFLGTHPSSAGAADGLNEDIPPTKLSSAGTTTSPIPGDATPLPPPPTEEADKGCNKTTKIIENVTPKTVFAQLLCKPPVLSALACVFTLLTLCILVDIRKCLKGHNKLSSSSQQVLELEVVANSAGIGAVFIIPTKTSFAFEEDDEDEDEEDDEDDEECHTSTTDAEEEEEEEEKDESD